MLAAYLTATRALLQLPGTNSTSLYSDLDLTRYINTARGQLAGETECIRAIGTISTSVGSFGPYNFSGITTGVAGINGVINVRSVRYTVGGGSLWIPPRPWEWFEIFDLNNAAPALGVPIEWSQYGQGAAPGSTGSSAGGSLYVSPPSDIIYPLNCDCSCYPSALASDADPEVIPYLWTDCVPFFAAYFALLSAQTNDRMNDALQYYKIYGEWVDRARKAANASPNRWQYQGAQDPIQALKLGIKGGGT